MNETVKLTRTTAGRAAALALAVVLLLAPVAWALGELEQKPGNAGCVSETGTNGVRRSVWPAILPSLHGIQNSATRR
jgi:hypothetical protein